VAAPGQLSYSGICLARFIKAKFAVACRKNIIQTPYTFVVIPAQEGWPLKPGIDVVSLGELRKKLERALKR
jgi:hypothetical protein